ncbi:ABC transporter ATP-binding protein [Pseudonocardia ailaonensis]|uniref:ABC transporter ATP-binding protein n=1 Tax=Pseudonocardia ailaonensis TaxID=367279 RepID=A0ABN2N6B1_9PSEU
MTGLDVRGLRRSYGDVPVLQGLDLTVPAGALTAVVGPSGCGKTTLLRLVAGFDRPGAGTVTIDGRAVTGPGVLVAPERRRIGYVTQDGTLFPHLTVARNITFGLPRRERRARHRVAELLELVGLDPAHADRRPDELSGGQQQRVALARALAPRPALVLLDEPFSSLDTELRASTRRAVVDALAAAGTTTVLVTHDQAEALSLAGRVAVMRDGIVVQEGPPAELYRRPGDRGVAAFLGEIVELPARLVEPGSRNGATVLVRPEQLTLTAGGDAGMIAEVLDVAFYGPYAEVRARTTEGTVVRARCPGHLVPEPGARVGISVTGAVL